MQNANTSSSSIPFGRRQTDAPPAMRPLPEIENVPRPSAWLIFDSLPFVLARYDAAMVCTYVNAAAEKFFGRGASDLLGLRRTEFPCAELERQRFRERLLAVFNGDIPTSSQRIEIQSSHGPRRCESTLVPERCGGAITAVLEIIRDETDTEGYVRDLESRIQVLGESNGRLREFAYAAAHDLQEPLRKVTSYISLIGKYSLPERVRSYFSSVDKASERMSRLIKDVLIHAAADADVQPTQETVCLYKIAQETIDDLELLINDKQAGIVLDPLPDVRAVKSQMRQLFQNLITNALKFARPGEPPRIHIFGARDSGDRVTVTVSDNGIGIPSSRHMEIFSPFRKGHDLPVPGSGLGLSICKRIVSNHGGTISVTSNIGEGTTFVLTLPAAGA